jgi:hypothetical protein
MKWCARCHNMRWVCEAHPDLPWEGDFGCKCGAPGEPCPICNRADDETTPELPEGFKIDKKIDWSE